MTNKRKSIDTGKTTYAFAGSQFLYDWIDNNPSLAAYPTTYTNDPHNIAMNDNVVSINNCIEVDLIDWETAGGKPLAINIIVETQTPAVFNFIAVTVKDQNTVEFLFDKELAQGSIAVIKAGIYLSQNTQTYQALGEGDQIIIDGKKIGISFAQPLSQENRIRITGGLITSLDNEILSDESETGVFSSQSVDECFIATAAFGSQLTWPVALLRHFRDQYLLTNFWGLSFVRFYYKNSPPIAAVIVTTSY